MINFENQYFRKLNFTENQIKQLSDSAAHDLEIAASSDIKDVVFKFCYDALIKLGIFLIAKQGYKVRSSAGHHVKILEKLSEILNDNDILVLSDKMRQERNINLYDGGFFISEKDSQEYLVFVKKVFEKAGVDIH
jgi:hypothetical protein